MAQGHTGEDSGGLRRWKIGVCVALLAVYIVVAGMLNPFAATPTPPATSSSGMTTQPARSSRLLNDFWMISHSPIWLITSEQPRPKGHKEDE